jgi:hypothetical protein
MKMPSTPEEREILLNELRKVVHAYMEFLDLGSAIAEANDGDLDCVFGFCQATAITTDTAAELGQTDLQEFLDCLAGTSYDG